MKETTQALTGKLTWVFWIALIPALLFFAVDILLHYLGVKPAIPFGSPRLWGIPLFILAVSCGVALPILMRARFQTHVARRKTVALSEYEAVQVRLILVSLTAALFADVAYLFLLPKLYLYGSILAGLYGIYGVIPSKRRILADLKYYGLED